MNCDTVDSILDQHRSARLSAVERQDVAAHLSCCARCSGSWTAHAALVSEPMGEPPPELFASVLEKVAAARGGPQTFGRPAWRMLVGVAAAVAVVAVAARYFPVDLGADVGTATGDAQQAVAALPAAPRFVAGRDYTVLAGARALPASDGVVPVTEFFMWGCYHCYSFEPELERWGAEAADRVALTRVPAIFNAEAELHARAFYTAEALGKLDSMSPAFYDEIHIAGNRLTSQAALADLFARFGVNAATFNAVFGSSDVDARVRRAAELGREYGIRATPSIVVAGRYLTSPSMAGTQMLSVVEQLVADEASCEMRCNGVGQPRRE